MATKRYKKQNTKRLFEAEPKVVGYIRVSTVTQAQTGDSLKAQRATIEEYCKSKGLELVEICSDEGISGTKSRKGRPGLDQALKCLENSSAFGIVTVYFDRFGRGGPRTVQDVLYVTEELGCRFICINLEFDTSTPGGKLMLQVMAATAKLFRDQISQKVKDTLKHKRDKGEVYGVIPFGKQVKNKKLVDDPVELDVIKSMQEYRVKHDLSFNKIAKLLNVNGIPPKKGKKWHAYTVQTILERVGCITS